MKIKISNRKCSGVTLRVLINVIGADKAKFLYKIQLTDRHSIIS